MDGILAFIILTAGVLIGVMIGSYTSISLLVRAVTTLKECGVVRDKAVEVAFRNSEALRSANNALEKLLK